MISLVFAACLIGTPHRCMTVNGGQFDTPIACMLGAQPSMAEWLDRHPGWEIKEERSTCQLDEPGLEEDL